MSNVKIELNTEGVRELLTSSEIQSMCIEQAESVTNDLGDGYVVEAVTYPERAGAIVRADSDKALRDNSDNNSMAKAVFK